tara:strand:- start:125 stop:529 length:405 start_codon:yes stop_codon:yes gene_type:complete
MSSKPLILLDKKYFYLMFTWQMFISIIRILPFIKVAFHKTINILEDITMSNKYFLKKSWVNVDVCVEDYHNSGTTLKDLEKLNWSPYSNIISREVKKTRHTIEEIDEKTYKEKVAKSNSLSSETKAVSVKDCKE